MLFLSLSHHVFRISDNLADGGEFAQSKQQKLIHDVLAMVWCDWFGRNQVGEWGMLPPPPSDFTLFFSGSSDAIISPPWLGCSSLQSRTMEIDNWFYSTTNCDGRSHLQAGGWQQRRGHSHRWRGVITIILIVADIFTFWWQHWQSVNYRL